jgi:DNA-binding transcriptional ArsR family regulator
LTRPLDPTKTLILRELDEKGQRSTKQLTEVLGITHKAVGKALRQLWDMKLVTQSFKVGSRETFWRPRDGGTSRN